MNFQRKYMFMLSFVELISFVISYGAIPIKYKGNLLSFEEYNKLELCENKWCLDDANRILEEISYNDTVEPCEDFNEFVCGTFFKERALNERYEYIGFRRNYELKLDEERHKALKASIDEKDGKAVKVTKNFYQRCINSRYIEKNSRKEILDYLSSFGTFPIQKPDWTEADLNFTKLLTETKLEYFLNFELVYCPSPIDGVEMICIIPERFHSWERYVSTNLKYTVKDVSDMYELLKFPTQGILELISKFKETYLKLFQKMYSYEKYFGSIKDLRLNISQMGLSETWLEVFNNQITESMKVSENALINIWSFEWFRQRIERFKLVDKRLFANLVMIDILYDYRNLFQVYAFDNKEYKTAIKTPQRFEICNRLLEKFIPIPARAIYARRYFTDEAKEKIEGYMTAAIANYADKLVEDNLVTPNTNLTRMRMIKPFAGYPNDMTNDSFLDRIYANLTLIGNETLFTTFRKLEIYRKFIDFMDLSDEDFLTMKIGKAIGDNAFGCTFLLFDYIYCPAAALRYPVFHPNRSQFYNMAMVLPEIYQALNSWNFVGVGSFEDLAFNDYQKWVSLNGIEPNLPGFLMNNEQMFWVALKLKNCVKGKIEYRFSAIRSKTGFKEAFNCFTSNKSKQSEWF